MYHVSPILGTYIYINTVYKYMYTPFRCVFVVRYHVFINHPDVASIHSTEILRAIPTRSLAIWQYGDFINNSEIIYIYYIYIYNISLYMSMFSSW
jgi:hypothetical protein